MPATPAVNAAEIAGLRRDLDRLERWVTRIILLLGSLGFGALGVIVTAILKGAGLP